VVARIAHLIARGLRDGGIDISVKKVTAGALMHDIGKNISFETGQDHSQIGRQICLENRLQEIAPIVGEHVRMEDYDIKGGYNEKEVVFYSDKRVNHDEIVSLDDRLAYILDRYGRNYRELRRAIQRNFDLCRRVEGKLMGRLGFGPEALPELAPGEDIYTD
jgi:uncharacterized protein